MLAFENVRRNKEILYEIEFDIWNHRNVKKPKKHQEGNGKKEQRRETHCICHDSEHQRRETHSICHDSEHQTWNKTSFTDTGHDTLYLSRQ